MSSGYDDNDASLNSDFGFCRSDKEPMIVTADFESLTRISKIIFKKVNSTYYLGDLVNKFRLEYQEDGEWLVHGEFETGMKEEFDKNYVYHIKLDKLVLCSQVRVVIEDHMVNGAIAGRVGFTADSDSISDRLLIKRSVEDLLAFKQADKVDEEPTKQLYEQVFKTDIDDHENLRTQLKYFKTESPFG